ncbi:Probable Membrane sulphatase [Flavobacterium indicum GPTSA100-9 = DSM 17447]|uniref:Probable Membrane sulphatase n=1 Tax=Flavobacterium indicum (strain DSM 17447 / CIP 109464 / GPTSA100-9) TaxID=1094466 RepID=H8XUC6_FLAIG|nr:alkaline phosphatase family protein [Flavobacterium indicum]CCG52909.1 Probable Membrane sulphatase [Flavobacterium indicum GPTSA100-9 = DSM 17447]
MQNFNKLVLLFFKRFFIVLFLYQVCRLLFLYFNYGSFKEFNFVTFLGGLHFDLSAIAYINLLFALLHFLPGKFKYSKRYQLALKRGFFIVNFIFILTNFVDFEYFKFTGRRSTFGLITASGMENEIGGLLISFLKEFWYQPLLAIGLGYIFWKIIPDAKHFSKDIETTNHIGKQSFLSVFLLAFVFLFARGGVQTKPLKIVDAVKYGNTTQSALVLNTPFCILKTIGKKETLEIPKFYSEEELNRVFNPITVLKSDSIANKKNVVVIILESFGRENVQHGQTPFFDSLIEKSLFFENGFANGKLSIDAVPSTLSSIPSLMNHSLITSSYAVNKVYGMPKLLKEHGYYTAFFHGAFNGSQNFDQYCNVAGFDSYFGKNEYVGPEAFDGSWGIFDEEFMQFFSKKMTTFKQPFFTTIFTISSHNPYTIPAKYINKFPKGKTKIQESIAYTDYALQQFFKSAEKQPWFKNTVFVLTADHTSSEPTEDKFSTNVGKFRIPILLFDPSNPSIVKKSMKNFQQIDIMPSILDYLNLPSKMISYGKSYNDKRDFVVYYLDNIYHYISNDYYLAFDGKQSIGLYNFKKDELLKNNLIQNESEVKVKLKMERFIKAYVQSFNDRMINNKLTLQ